MAQAAAKRVTAKDPREKLAHRRMTEGGPTERRAFSLDVPETVAFTAERPLGVPARIVFRPQEPFVLRNMPVDRLRFGSEMAARAGETTFISTIRDGEVRVPEIDVHYELSAGTGVAFKDLQGHVRRLEFSKPGIISIDLDGSAQSLTLFRDGHERNVTPRLLYYLYHNQQLSFLFAAASFMWGGLWSLKRLIGA